MSSCSSSSNINSTTTNVNLNSIGSRILATIQITSSDYTVEAGIEAGDVIRYDVSDPSNKIYRKSKADTIENAEVIGVVESVDTLHLNVVVFGQINFPSSKLTNLSEDTTGATGGNDIYFLSPSATGGVQNLAPFDQTQVIKPILQIADDGVNNAIVLNYIGYAVGGAIASESLDELIGELREFLDVGQTLPPSLLRVDQGTQRLNVSDYEELYGVIGKIYGFDEVVTLNSSSLVKASLVGQRAKQIVGGATTFSATVRSVDTTTNSITFQRGPGLDQIKTNVKLIIDETEYTADKTTVTKFVLPQIVTSGSARISVDSSVTTGRIGVAIVAKNIRGISIPRKVVVKELEVTDKLTTSTNAASTLLDINNTVNTVKSDLETVQRNLGLIT